MPLPSPPLLFRLQMRWPNFCYEKESPRLSDGRGIPSTPALFLESSVHQKRDS